MSSMTLTHTNGSTPPKTLWSGLTVQKFFEAVNWEDNPPEVQEIKRTASQGDNRTLSLMLTVSQFFGAVNWDGTAIAAVPPPQEEPEAQVASGMDQFTLDDFSSLF